MTKKAEFTFIGAGPSNLILIVNVLGRGIDPKQITVIGDQKGGAFANELSAGSSVPGNTKTKEYKKLYEDLYKLVPSILPPKAMKFDLDAEQDETTCSLNVAAGPLRYIAEKISNIVNYIEGRAIKIKKTDKGYHIAFKRLNGSSESIYTHQAILGIGGEPRVGKLPSQYKDIQILNPHDTFIDSVVREKFSSRKLILANIGSSHSAALATMHFIKAGHSVVQFMNKEYLYAETIINPNGSKMIKHDDTGLKGEVARWTKEFLKDLSGGNSPYHTSYKRYIGKDKNEIETLLKKHLNGCTHAVFTIGYNPAQTLKVEGFVLSRENHNSKTMQFHNMKGLWGNGLAFAEMVNNAQSNGLAKYHLTAAKLAPRLIAYASEN
ncbi:MAG: hypothetical protein JO131_10000 [Gammaproteobacteria bacterium]|nr:hypothetical protein [Gammaproteobacteria bacterium]